MMNRGLLASLILMLSMHASAQSVNPPAARTGPPPIEDFLRKPKFSSLTLSPDGKLLAAIVPINGRRNLALIDFDKNDIVALTNLRAQDVYTYEWVGDRMLHVQVANLGEAGRLVELKQDVLIDTTGRVVRNDPPVIIGTLDRAGDDLLVEKAERSSRSTDVYRYNPRTNDRQLLTGDTPGNVRRFVADRTGQVRIAVSVPSGGERTMLYYRRDNDAKWTLLRDDPAEDDPIRPIAFGFDNKTLYVRARNASRGGLFDIYAYDPETNALGERVSAIRDADAGALLFDYEKKVPAGVRDTSPAGTTWVDPEWKALQASIDAAMPGTRNRLSWGRYDSNRVIVETQSATQPPVFFLFDRKTSRLQEVASAYPWFKESELSARNFVRYKARDGLSIPGFLTMPRHPDGAKPPLVVVIHGGPYVPADGFGFDPQVQFLASRGYAVLQPDFRGTIGYGDAFYKAGWKQWGYAMQDDVTDGVKWLIDTGKVDADRVCLFGGSYGGYATLWGLEKEPQMFRCGIAQVAVSDLELIFDVGWSDFMAGERDGDSTNTFKRWIGDPSKEKEKMRAVSPIRHADRIQAPLMLAYGAADRRVPIVHGKEMRSALDQYDKPYEWVVYDDEGHGFSDDANRLDFYRRIEAFLAKNLAVRSGSSAAATADGKSLDPAR